MSAGIAKVGRATHDVPWVDALQVFDRHVRLAGDGVSGDVGLDETVELLNGGGGPGRGGGGRNHRIVLCTQPLGVSVSHAAPPPQSHTRVGRGTSAGVLPSVASSSAPGLPGTYNRISVYDHKRMPCVTRASERNVGTTFP